MKKLSQILFFVLVIGLTMYGVFHGQDFDKLLELLSTANPGWLIVCGVMVLGFIGCESWIIHDMFAKLNIKTKRGECFLYSCVGFFFSCVTPSASGGQPAQMMYMKKKGIRISSSTNVLMWVTILYKMVLVIIGLGLLAFRMEFIHLHMGNTVWLFYLGIFLNVACVCFMFLMWIKSEWIERIGRYVISILHRFHIGKKHGKKRKRLRYFIQNYDNSFMALRTEIALICKAFVITFLQRMMLFSITAFVYLSFGLKGFSFIDIVILQSVISIAVDMLPLPGGSGIAEHLFLVVFAGIFKGGLLLPAMVLSRGIAYYVQLVFCAVMTVVAHIYFTRTEVGAEEVEVESVAEE